MTGPRPVCEIIRDRQLRAYFQCCCALRFRPTGAGAPQSLLTAYTHLDRAAGQPAHLGPIAAAAGRALAGLRRPGAIERAFARHGFAVRPGPPGPDAA